jgi:2-dehydro-3-deoxygluconokinase
VVDTTAAGDAFNAGFLAARARGQEPLTAAQSANRVAALVIQHRGAILPRQLTPQLRAACGIEPPP